MARIVRKDTFAFEQVAPDTEVRRQVFAGQYIPDTFRVEDSSAVEDTDAPPRAYAAAIGDHPDRGGGYRKHQYADAIEEEDDGAGNKVRRQVNKAAAKEDPEKGRQARNRYTGADEHGIVQPPAKKKSSE